MRFDDEATALQALISGQIDVVGTGLLVNRTLNRNDPGKNYEVKIVLRPLHFGIGIRRGQTELLQWLNTFVYTIKNNGELDAISRKWRQLPLERPAGLLIRASPAVDYVFQFGVVWRDFDALLLGAWLTVKLSALAMVLGLIVGVAGALAAASRRRCAARPGPRLRRGHPQHAVPGPGPPRLPRPAVDRPPPRARPGRARWRW